MTIHQILKQSQV